MSKMTWKLIEMHDNGFSAEGIMEDWGTVTTSGYDIDAQKVVDENHHKIEPGCPVIDIRNAPNLVTAVCRAPLVDIKATKVDSFLPHMRESVAAVAMAMEGTNTFGQYIRGYLNGTYNLDKVPLALYLEYWRQAGARMGVVNSEMKIEWEVDKSEKEA